MKENIDIAPSSMSDMSTALIYPFETLLGSKVPTGRDFDVVPPDMLHRLKSQVLGAI